MTSPAQPNTPTELLGRLEHGDESAREQLLRVLYDDLRRLASSQLSREAPGHTLDPTALVNEAYLKVFAAGGAIPATSKPQLLALVARAMRQVLIDHARARRSLKRGGGSHREALDDLVLGYEERGLELTALQDVLEKLMQLDPELVQVVDMRFFAGFTNREIAEILGKSERSIERAWSTARAFLKIEWGS